MCCTGNKQELEAKAAAVQATLEEKQGAAQVCFPLYVACCYHACMHACKQASIPAAVDARMHRLID